MKYNTVDCIAPPLALIKLQDRVNLPPSGGKMRLTEGFQELISWSLKNE